MKVFAEKGMTMIVVTHEMNSAQRVAYRGVVFDRGKLPEKRSPKHISERTQAKRTRPFLYHLGWE